MLFSLLLVLLLGQGPATPPPTFADAVQLANGGRHAEAMAAFQARAAANPADHQARLWIRMGDDGLAEAVYRSVLLEDPLNVEAMTGVGRTLLARDEIDEALEVLERAEQLAPRNDEVLGAIGRAHRQAGRTATAIGYLERAYSASPTLQHQMRLRDARLAYQHRVETRGFNEQFNGATADSNSGELMLNYRLRDTLRVTARGQVQRKFGVQDQRGGGGVEWQWKPAVMLFGHAIIGPDNVVMPEGDFLGAVTYAAPQATWGLSVRYFDFTGAWVSVVSPSVVWNASDRLALHAGYALSTTESNTFSNRQNGHSGWVRGAYRLFPRIWVTAGFAGGVEDFENFSVDRIGNFKANTAAGGVRVDFATLTSLAAGYERQWREAGQTMGRVSVSLAQRF